MLVDKVGKKIVAFDGRIFLSVINPNKFQINVWDKLYKGSLDHLYVDRDTLKKYAEASSILYHYFMMHDFCNFLEVDEILELTEDK